MLKKETLLLFFILFSGMATVSYGQIYVDKSASGANDGTSWADAYTSLQSALGSATGSDVIVIAGGIYKPGTNRDDSFIITANQEGLKVYGGWAGTETFTDAADVQAQLDGRDLVANQTVLSGDIDNDDITTGGVTRSADDIRGGNSFHVLVFSAGGLFTSVQGKVTNATVLDGITVTGGEANSSDLQDTWGGGIFCSGGFETGNECSPRISNIKVIGNFAEEGGGGIYNLGFNDGASSPTIINAVFSGNAAGDWGGAIVNDGRRGTNHPVIINAVFVNNKAETNGGAIYNRGFDGDNSPSIINATFTNNAADKGGAIYNIGTGGISDPRLTNTLLWSNTANVEGDEIFNEEATAILSHTLIQGGVNGGGVAGNANTDDGNNIDVDPEFLRAGLPAGIDGVFGTSDDGLRVRETSPALDAGLNDTVTVATDLTGAPRIQDGTVDLGAYEGGAQPQIYVDENASSGGDGTSWGSAFNNLQDALAVAGGANEIWIAEGIYTPGSTQDANFTINGAQNGIQLYGGFNGSETQREQRDPKSHRTILSGDIGGDDSDPEGDGIIRDASDINGSNSYHVLLLDGRSEPITTSTVLDGLVVTAGQANGTSIDDGTGGGLFCNASDGNANNGECSPAIRELIFAGNSAASQGGGVYFKAQDDGVIETTISNSFFIGNMADGGGAIASISFFEDAKSIITIQNSVFIKNISLSHGGAIDYRTSDGINRLNLTNVSFVENSADTDGGAIYNLAQTVQDNPLTEALIFPSNVIFYGNRADADGDGSGAGDNITNKKSDTSTEGTVSSTLTHTLLEGGDGGVSNINGATSTYLDGNGNSTSFSNSTNIDADPMFFARELPAGDDQIPGTADDGLRLLPGSPALNAGTNNSVSMSTDMVGANRIQDGTVDMGAYEGAFMNPQQLTITGSEGWRMMTAPADNISYADLLDPLWTQGFPGADRNNSGDTPNVYTWDESAQQFQPVTDGSAAPDAGQGFIAYVYDDQDYDGNPEGFPKTLDLDQGRTGGTITPALSYTDNGTANDGFNLVGNPYGITIDWDNPNFAKTNLNAPFYVWSDSANSGTGAYLSWNGSAGTLPDGKIAPWQGFWVQANGASPTLQFTDGVRDTGGTFYKETEQEEAPQVTFELAGTQLKSKAVVMFNGQAQAGRDRLDALKLESLNEQYLSLYTTDTKRHALDINALPKELEKPLRVALNFKGSNVGGKYTLSWDPQGLPDSWAKGSVTLVDKYTDQNLNLYKAGKYTFKVEEEKKQKTSGESGSSAETRLIASPQHGPIPTILKAKAPNPRFVLTVSPNGNGQITDELPKKLQLNQNYPNPFNPTTNIKYALPEAGNVELEVYDVLGRRVQSLVNEEKAAGRYNVTLDGSNLASGVYFYRLQTPMGTKIHKMTLIK